MLFLHPGAVKRYGKLNQRSGRGNIGPVLASPATFLAISALAAATGRAGPSAAPAGEIRVEGEYDSPLGRLRLRDAGGQVTGTLVAPSAACAFHAGDEVLRGTLLDDALSGQLRVCLRGPSCAAEAWAGMLLLVTPDRLDVHRAREPSRARRLVQDGAAYLQEGRFEAARKQFLAALELAPGLVEAYNGVGVTFRMRDDLAEALRWYKRALAVDPDFGDAYYNMACVYALQGRRALALRYLQIAAVNGYASAEGIDADPDLAALRATPEYRALRERL
jgi:Tetratricopeptide repeat